MNSLKGTSPVDTRTKNVRTKDVHKRTVIFGHKLETRKDVPIGTSYERKCNSKSLIK